jgi:hypothetical protein
MYLCYDQALSSPLFCPSLVVLLSNNAASEHSASESPHAGTFQAATQPGLNAYYVLSVLPIKTEVNNRKIKDLEFRGRHKHFYS